MAKILRNISWLVLGTVLLALGYGILSVAISFVDFLGAADPNVAAAIIGAGGTALTTVCAVLFAQYYSRKREIAEAHRERKIQIYDDFLTRTVNILKKSSEDDNYKLYEDKKVLDFLFKFQKEILLWASPKVIRSWLEFRRTSGQGSPNTILKMEGIIRSMRHDLGLGNGLLARGELIKVLMKNESEVDELLNKKK